MRSSFDDSDIGYWCHLGVEPTDTVKGSAGDGSSGDGGTIPENTFDWSVGQAFLPCPVLLARRPTAC